MTELAWYWSSSISVIKISAEQFEQFDRSFTSVSTAKALNNWKYVEKILKGNDHRNKEQRKRYFYF